MTVDATEQWWGKKLQENPDFKGFKKKGIEPQLTWKMFGDVVATGEPAGALSSRVLPEHAKPVEGSGDTNERDQDIRAWWLQREYDQQNANARFAALLSALSVSHGGFQQLQPPPPPQGP
ncbi:hypothetical protein GQ457_09G009770 [Hibiscus cannabinus]